MKNLTAKCLSLMMLALLLSGNAQASHDGYANGDDCCPRQYECGCNPLYCGAWDLQIQAGVNPILWRNRGPITAINCNPNLSSAVVTVFNQVPKFNKFFKTPWVVGGQVGYALSDNTRIYLEFDYSQAKRKENVLINSDSTPTIAVTFNWEKYKLFEGYVGARYYWDRWCDRASFFLGGKVGFTRHRKNNLTLLIAIPSFTPVSLPAAETFRRNTILSGGFNLGLDYCVCGNWSIVLTGEVVASCGPRGVGVLLLPTVEGLAGFRSLVTGEIGTELRFPVTLAVRYSF
jgi:hypothetical protein